MIRLVVCVGAVLLAGFLSAEFKKYRRRRLLVCEELYQLIVHISRQISCYLRPTSQLLADYSTPILDECGFLDVARRDGLLSALCTLRDELDASGEEMRLLTALFSSMGKGYLSQEIKLLEGYRAEFYQCLSKHRAAVGADLRLVGTLFAAAAVSLVILIV